MKAIEINKDRAVLNLTYDEIRTMRSCIGEALEAVVEWEFPIRTGIRVVEAKRLLGDYLELLEEMEEKRNSDP